MLRAAGKRLASTKATSYQLPPEKLRALTSIYHQAGSFITAENLSERIDEAFAKDAADQIVPDFISKDDLKQIRVSQRQRPKVSEWEKNIVVGPLGAMGAEWSGRLTRREGRVIEALYGVDGTVKGKQLPGLEVVEEEDHQKNN